MEATSILPLLERQDCRLVTWYRSLYAPRTGGAYDSHHRMAGIAGRTRRRSGAMAARGAGAAARSDYRVLGNDYSLGLGTMDGSFHAAAARTWLWLSPARG